MARFSRFILPGQPHHVIQRGNNRQTIFLCEEDYHYYLDRLLYASEEHECDIHAYVLMTNHVHFLVSPVKEENIGKMMQTLGRYYVRYFNYKYKRTGTLWEGRYKAALINSEQYLFTCMRYIELNPVRARIVLNPIEYSWSSYLCNAIGMINPLIKPHDDYQRLGLENYQALFNQVIEQKELDAIRDVTNQSRVLGNHQFKQAVEKILNRKIDPKSKGGDR
ncbi:MAG: transposase, partial [Gammaproteobacteria bacterium]|nr:transposase [Gammaproteobacteria bacterium]